MQENEIQDKLAKATQSLLSPEPGPEPLAVATDEIPGEPTASEPTVQVTVESRPQNNVKIIGRRATNMIELTFDNPPCTVMVPPLIATQMANVLHSEAARVRKWQKQYGKKQRQEAEE